MVTLKRLEARGFRKLDLQIDFPEKGLLIIKGPNESGKSTILEAILYALYGKTLRGTKDLAINHAQNTAIIKLWFEIDGKQFLVERTIRRNGPTQAALFQLTNGHRLIATSVSRVNEEISKLLGGISLNELLVTNIVAQKELDKIAELKPRERDKIINLLMGLESYNKAKEKLQEERRETRIQLESAKKILEAKREKLEKYREDLQKFQQRSEELATAKKEYENTAYQLQEYLDIYNILRKYKEKLEQKSKISKEIEDKKEKVSLLEQNIRDNTKSIVEKQKLIKENSDKIKNLEKQKQELQEELKKYKDLEGIKLTIEQISENYKTYKEKLLEKKKIKEILLKNEKNLKTIEEQIKGTEIEKILKKEEELNKRLEKTKPKTIVYIGLLALSLLGIINIALVFIGILLATIYWALNQRKKTQILQQLQAISLKRSNYEQLIVQYNSLKNSLSHNKRELENINDEIKDYEEKIKNNLLAINTNYLPQHWITIEELYEKTKQNIDNALEIKRKLENDLKNIESKIKDLRNFIENYTKEINDLENKNKELQKRLEQIKTEIKGLEKQLNEIKLPTLPPNISYSEEYYNEVQTKVNNLQNEKSRLEERINNLKREIEELEERIEENKNAEKEYQEAKQKVEELETLEKALIEAIEAIKTVSQQLRENFRPSIENYMSTIINRITGGRYKAVKIDQKFDIKVFDSQAGKFIPKDIYSGGTIDQFLLAMRLAFILSLLPATKQTYPKFLFLDEPLASSDTQRRQNILRLLTKDLSTYFKQIILITHLDIKPPNTTIIKLQEGKIAN